MKKNAFFLVAFLLGLALTSLSNRSYGQLEEPITVLTKPNLDVPYVPTNEKVVEAMIGLAQIEENDVLYDLGCGDGRIVIAAAQKAGCRAVGVDIDPERISESRFNAKRAGMLSNVEFKEEDLFKTDIRNATVITMYLLPDVNIRLRPRLLTELKPGTRLISHDFDMDEWKPDKFQVVENHSIYYWVVPANVSGTWAWENERGETQTLDIEQHFQHGSGIFKTRTTTARIEGIKVQGEWVTFAGIIEDDRGVVPAVFIGRLTGNDTVEGRIEAKDRETMQWKARRESGTQKDIAG